ncbi:GGDEF domain-containing protein [Pseudomonas sp. CFBP 13602]|uniref:GGDEF domain-containing protein n=1 Tax=Pseudomonas sp. CFBP 13602 TaxID=2774039 RepID=UPI00177D1BA7|nr:GGDEF domain-containing protein [Pseudomonas sp. CFBP 13602]MBD8827542.1 sensor domain-containing diguanylate cyclase [Pseudomonas sp. CFBP 13602]
MLIRRRPSLAGFIGLALGLIVFSAFSLLRSEIQRQETRFSEYVQSIAGTVRNQLDTNDAVLAGFAAFLQAVKQSDTDAAARYGAAVLAAYPHIYMLEVARSVPVDEQFDFTALLRRTWLPDFELKNFEVKDAHMKGVAPAEPGVGGSRAMAEATWPILFMSPQLPQASVIYGVRLETVPYLANALARIRQNPLPVVSPVFALHEGGNAYILMKSVSRPDEDTQHTLPNFFGSTMVAMLLIKTDALLGAIVRHNSDSRVAVSAQLHSPDSPSQVVAMEPVAGRWWDELALPRLTDSVYVDSPTQPVSLSFQRQLRLMDVLGPGNLLILAILMASLVVVPMVLVRHFSAIEAAELEHERSAFLATHDVLTQLPNRYLLADRFTQALQQWTEQGVPFAVMLIDLDHFKQINDEHGHAVGDQVLQALAKRMRETVRHYDTVARYGGDEFVALVSDLTNPDSVILKAQQLLDAIELPIGTSVGALSLSGSVGISLCPVHGEDLDTLLKAADQAMYQVKLEGRQGVAMAGAV